MANVQSYLTMALPLFSISNNDQIPNRQLILSELFGNILCLEHVLAFIAKRELVESVSSNLGQAKRSVLLFTSFIRLHR